MAEPQGVVTNAPICKTQICKLPLTYLEKQGCWRCLVCNPIPKDTPKPKEQKKFLDVAMTEKRVREIIAERGEPTSLGEEHIREIVQDELMNWHIQKPSVTKDEIGEMTDAEALGDLSAVQVPEPKLDWRAQAKELGINTFQMKKVDVLAAIESEKLRRT